MLLINVKVIVGAFTEEQKQQMARRVTESMVAIAGENLRAITWVLIEEVGSGQWAIGGQPLTTANIQALAAKGLTDEGGTTA